jgi:hypothetical protein
MPVFESGQVAVYRLRKKWHSCPWTETSFFPPGSKQEALTECSRKTRPHSSCYWGGTRFLSRHETVPVYGFLGQDDGSL